MDYMMNEELKTWEQMSHREQLECIWWDLYKDVNGFRPRGINISAWSDAALEAELKSLEESLESVMRQEKEAQDMAIGEFEKRVKKTIELGAGSRETALLWIMDAEEANGDFEYLAFKLNLPFHYFDEK